MIRSSALTPADYSFREGTSMKILSRKVGEQIRVGDGIVITVTRTATGEVDIGVDAPQNVAIRKGEDVPASGSDLTPEKKPA